MSVEVKQILKPKKYGSGGTTIIRGSGYASTTNNSSIQNGNVTTLSASTISGMQGNFEILNTTSFTSNYGSVTNLTAQNLNVNGSAVMQDLDVNNITQHGDFTANSTNFANEFNIEQVVSYLGTHNYFDELTGSETSNITSHNINTEYLTVTKSAHFFELIIDKIKAAGGSVLFTPADGFTIDDVENIASLEYLDGCIFGLFDLSADAAGKPGDVFCEENLAMVNKCVEVCKRNKKSVGIMTFATDKETIKRYHDLGINMISTGADYQFILEGAKKSLATMSEILGK